MRNLPSWAIRTIDTFYFIRDYGYQQPLLAFGNSILIVGIPEPILWRAENDNEAKP